MRAVTVPSSMGFGDNGRVLEPRRFPLFFELVRYWYGPQLAAKIVAEFRRQGGPIPVATIHRRLLAEGLEPFDVKAILDATFQPTPVGFGNAGKKNLNGLGDLGISKYKSWGEVLTAYALPVAAIAGIAFIPGVGSTLLDIGKSIGSNFLNMFGGTAFGSEKAETADSAAQAELQKIAQEAEADKAAGGEGTVSEPTVVQRVVDAVSKATGVEPSEALQGLVQGAIDRYLPDQFKSETTEEVDKVTYVQTDADGNVVQTRDGGYRTQDGVPIQPKSEGIPTEYLLLGGGALLLVMMMTMRK